MTWIEKLISPLQNSEAVALQYVKQQNLKISRTTLQNALREHPDYPSMLALSDVFNSFGVESMALRVESIKTLADKPLPLIVQVQSEAGDSLFALVLSIGDESVIWYNPVSGRRETIPIDELQVQYTGVVQFLAADEASGEKHFEQTSSFERNKRIQLHLFALALPVSAVFLGVAALLAKGVVMLVPVLLLLLFLIGSIVSALLIIYEADQYNPELNKVCRGGKRTSCAAILNSPASSFWGISWSVTGFSYFMGLFLLLLGGGIFYSQLLTVVAWFNLLVMPYTVFSVYYQWRVAKQWCPMCLTTQAVLVLILLVSLFSGLFNANTFTLQLVVLALLTVFVVFLASYILLPQLQLAKASQKFQHNYQQLKHTKGVFEALLEKERRFEAPTEGLGVILGNPEGSIKLLKVCNPYCGPCAQAHPVLDELIKNNPEIRLQIIFTATSHKEDIRSKPVKAFLAQQKRGANELSAILNAWYLSDDADVDALIRTFNLSDDLIEQEVNAIDAMAEWCKATKIEYTPTFFLNQHQLPESYSVTDLRYLLSV